MHSWEYASRVTESARCGIPPGCGGAGRPENRVHANVTVTREPCEPERDALARQLSRLFGKRVVPHISTNPAILGGLIVKVGDTVIDGSVRKRLSILKQRMLTTVAR